MQIFISWSGEISKQVALVFHKWLPLVIQSVETYMSSEDIRKGSKWSEDVFKALDKFSFGLLCITKDNLESTWINFEAGALLKSFKEESKISPFLFDLKAKDLKGPLTQFQCTVFDKGDILNLLKSINKCSDDIHLQDQRLETVFDNMWPNLENSLKAIPSTASIEKDDTLAMQDMVEEILLLSRNLQQKLSKPENILPFDYIRSVMPHKNQSNQKQENNYDLYNKLIMEFEFLDKLFSEYFSDPELPQKNILDEIRDHFEKINIVIGYFKRDISKNIKCS